MFVMNRLRLAALEDWVISNAARPTICIAPSPAAQPGHSHKAAIGLGNIDGDGAREHCAIIGIRTLAGKRDCWLW